MPYGFTNYRLDGQGTAIPLTAEAREAFTELQQALNSYASYFRVSSSALPTKVDGLWGAQTAAALTAVKTDYDARGFPLVAVNPQDRVTAAELITNAIAKALNSPASTVQITKVAQAGMGGGGGKWLLVALGAGALLLWKQKKKRARRSA